MLINVYTSNSRIALEGRAIVSNKEIPIQKFIPLSNLRKPNVPLPSLHKRKKKKTLDLIGYWFEEVN